MKAVRGLRMSLDPMAGIERVRELLDPDHLPALDLSRVRRRPAEGIHDPIAHPPRVLLLYGSLRQRSFSRFATEEAARFASSAQRRASLTPAIYRFPIRSMGMTILRSVNCVRCRFGPRRTSGVAQNGMAPSRA